MEIIVLGKNTEEYLHQRLGIAPSGAFMLTAPKGGDLDKLAVGITSIDNEGKLQALSFAFTVQTVRDWGGLNCTTKTAFPPPIGTEQVQRTETVAL